MFGPSSKGTARRGPRLRIRFETLRAGGIRLNRVPGVFLRVAEGFEDSIHVGGVLLLFGQGLLDHGSRGAFIVSEIADDLAVGLNGDPFGDRVFPHHVERRLAFRLLGMAAHGEPFGIKIGITAELADALRGYGLAVDAAPYVIVPYDYASAVNLRIGG